MKHNMKAFQKVEYGEVDKLVAKAVKASGYENLKQAWLESVPEAHALAVHKLVGGNMSQFNQSIRKGLVAAGIVEPKEGDISAAARRIVSAILDLEEKDEAELEKMTQPAKKP